MNRRATRRPAHPVAIRIMHWVGVYAMGCMIFSGWEIYNASPSLPFLFPPWTGLGGWLGGALAWHLSAMWLLFADGIAYLVYGFASGHFRNDLKPPAPRATWCRTWPLRCAFAWSTGIGHYNAVQRLLYGGVITAISSSADRAGDLEAGAVRLADRPVRRLPDRPRHPSRHHVRHRRLPAGPCRAGGDLPAHAEVR